MNEQAPYDAIIIGGGPAGLTCAIFLGRYRRRILLLDDHRPRNYATKAIHGFLGYHAIAPGELRDRGRAEATESGVELRDARAEKIERNGDLFDVILGENDVLRARRIVLAYGVRDTLPDIPEIESYYGITMHHCPDCDGYESRDQRIGVIGWGKAAAALALKLLQWSNDIVIFTHGRERGWDEEISSKLLAELIDIKDERIVAVTGTEGRVSSAVLDTGERVPMQRLFFTIKVERSTTLAEELGCEVESEAPNVVVNEYRETTVGGVYAVGDLVAGSQLAITAASDGAIAAIAINKSLLPPGRLV